ncbi:uncharacterized protein LOC131064664 [Cryptomeria japonica]|uniref:uncharacterized protein LOC131064664 n=1 Tax=Cryptomeria japonica TaxID=3369 RepID=UPI0027D9DE2D|nr:uncharacterized protein LOC131064664 [Cryptomeria japonica]
MDAGVSDEYMQYQATHLILRISDPAEPVPKFKVERGQRRRRAGGQGLMAGGGRRGDGGDGGGSGGGGGGGGGVIGATERFMEIADSDIGNTDVVDLAVSVGIAGVVDTTMGSDTVATINGAIDVSKRSPAIELTTSIVKQAQLGKCCGSGGGGGGGSTSASSLRDKKSSRDEEGGVGSEGEVGGGQFGGVKSSSN